MKVHLSFVLTCFFKPEDWYSVQLTDLWQVGFPMGVSKVTLAELLAKKYPSYKWEKLYLLKGRFAQQKRLEQAVEALFPVLFLQPLTNEKDLQKFVLLLGCRDKA